jgi:hypothetical protein
MAEAAMDATPAESSDESLETTEIDNESLENDSADAQEIQEDSGASQTQKKATQKSAKQQLKELGEQDLDALVTVKLDGKVEKMSVREALKRVQLEQVSQKRMQEAAQERKRAAALVQLAKDDPDKFFELTGLDADTFAENRLARKYERAQMTPEQRELAELKEEKENRERAEMQSKAELISQIEELVGSKAPEEIKRLPKERLLEILDSQKQVNAKEQETLDSEIGGAWKESGLPKHKYFVQLMAATILSHQRRTKQPLQAKEAAAIVKKDFLKSVSEILESMDPQGIQEVLGKQTLQKLRDFDVARVTGRSSVPNQKDQQRPGNQPASHKIQKSKPMNEFEYREYLKSLRDDLRD